MNIGKMIDASCDTTSYIDAMIKEEITHVGRYYNNGNSETLKTKCLTKVEANALSSAELQLVVVFQKGQKRIDDFDAEKGEKSARQALKCAEEVGQPLGSAIYFSVDYDACLDDVKGGITAYFESVNRLLKGKYKVGVYGSGLVCKTLYDANLCHYRWLSMSEGYCGTQNSDKEGDYDIKQLTLKAAKDIYQVSIDRIGTLKFDYDALHGVGSFQVAPEASNEETVEYLVNTSSGTLNLRELPSMSSKVISRLQRGEQLTPPDGWVYVKTKDGQYGYVSNQFIKCVTLDKD
ncbi:glycoside hydrolase domain-containing protein [Vibrio ostreicida]|uniref:DUF1906 domain-containing protein n=1 Tax=Vibrio ostreicida TaxID=526588 RepID=A0ABT8BWG9_9VIBR|nr:glycoside hydrolase domain-containing protein [Vibrio ostreicida]MDN3611531.1 DUF1906 domain-containing protein [Vibrio ostreicida]NPD09025.1 DUF1906 domain-containing protein [Vibrio ostreicida]